MKKIKNIDEIDCSIMLLEEIDKEIVARVSKLAEKYQATMTQIALAWQFAKGVASPIVGVSKIKYLDDAVGALNITLTNDDVKFLEELYISDISNEYSARDCAPQPLKLSIHSGGIEHPCRCR